MIEVAGLGVLDDTIVVLRSSGQSYTCKERRTSLTVKNDDLSEIAFVRLDHGLFPEGNVSDYSISLREVPRGFILELKGRHMYHAIEQLGRSLKKVSLHCSMAVVVSSGAQKIPTGEWQKAQRKFLADNHVRLCRFPNNAQVTFHGVVNG